MKTSEKARAILTLVEEKCGQLQVKSNQAGVTVARAEGAYNYYEPSQGEFNPYENPYAAEVEREREELSNWQTTLEMWQAVSDFALDHFLDMIPEED